MADRSLRGMRLGSTSLQSEEGVSFSPRQRKTYRTSDGTTFEVVFSADAEVPEVWESPKSGLEGRLLERRTRAELEELLEERLATLRARRGQHRIGA
jgi:hypothetical protein